MNRLFKLIIMLTLAVLFLDSIDAMAGGARRRGTNAADELLIPVGARFIAMGGASAAIATGVDALYWNPAGLDRMSYNAAAMFSYMNHIADINVSYLSVGARFSGIGSIGLSFKTLSFGDIPITTVEQPEGTGGVFSPQFLTMGISYSRSLTDRVHVGATAKLITETMDKVSSTGFAFDIGVQYTGLAEIKGLSVGVVVKNLGPAMQFGGNGLLNESKITDADRPPSFSTLVAGKDELPSVMEIGLAYKYSLGESGELNFTGMFQNNNYQDDLGLLGAEYSFNDMFFLRGGYRLSLDGTKEGDDNIYIYGASFGAGFHYDLTGVSVTLDYAYRAANFFDANNVFTLTLGF